MGNRSALPGTGLCFILGGLLSAAWGGWLLVGLLARPGAITTESVVAIMVELGRPWELLMLAATVCWLIGLFRLTVERRHKLRPVHLVLPLAGEVFYLLAMMFGADSPRWPLPVPPGALGTVCWSLGLCGVGVTALRSPHWRGPARELPLAIGLFFFAVTLPLLFAVNHPPIYLTGLGWGSLWVALGVLLWQEGKESHLPRRPTRVGDVYENPATGERVVIRIGTHESAGEFLVADLYLRPGARVPAEHIHPAIDERFTVLQGRVGFRLNGVESVAKGVSTVSVPAGVSHDWWNAGPDEARVRVEIGPADRFEEMIMNIFGLAQDGRVNAKGMPSLLQLALFAQEFDDVIRFTDSPRWVQLALFGLLAPVARLLGYRGSYAEYLSRGPSSAVIVRPPEETAFAQLESIE